MGRTEYSAHLRQATIAAGGISKTATQTTSGRDTHELVYRLKLAIDLFGWCGMRFRNHIGCELYNTNPFYQHITLLRELLKEDRSSWKR